MGHKYIGMLYNTYHSAGFSRRQIQNVNIFVKILKITEFHYYILFVISMKNASRYVQTCLVLASNL